MVSILQIIGIAAIIAAIFAYILKRDSDVDNGAKPLSWKIPGVELFVTPSRWAWRKIRENKNIVIALIVVVAIAVQMLIS